MFVPILIHVLFCMPAYVWSYDDSRIGKSICRVQRMTFSSSRQDFHLLLPTSNPELPNSNLRVKGFFQSTQITWNNAAFLTLYTSRIHPFEVTILSAMWCVDPLSLEPSPPRLVITVQALSHLFPIIKWSLGKEAPIVGAGRVNFFLLPGLSQAISHCLTIF